MTVINLPKQQNYLESAKGVLQTEADALTKIIEILDDSFNQVIGLLLKAKGRVIVTGMGKSGHIARKIAATFASTGQPAVFVHPAEASHGDMGMITSQDVVIALSNSGETAELADLIEYTRRYQIPLIALTRRKASTLVTHAEYAFVLPDSPEACPMKLAPTTSAVMMLAFGDALAVALLEARRFTPADFKVFHPGGNLGSKLQRVGSRMHTGEQLPLVRADNVMGETIILISEKGFGCAGVTDENGRLIGMVTDGDLRRHMSHQLLQQPVGEVMTVKPTTVQADLLMTEALALMNHKKITALFVVENGIPIGIIHVHDFLRAGIV